LELSFQIGKNGRPEAPTLAAPELQAQLKARDQAVDMVNRGCRVCPNAAGRCLCLLDCHKIQQYLKSEWWILVKSKSGWLTYCLIFINKLSKKEKKNDDRNE